ncbi:hypothetical protein AAF712_010355 [Marasmius tenuissimus]|uniref:Protein-S-isoprenylcysteine O-methyltransferase n=1 Tax=Marasmius tenuissimus TaxID=585030 RepID=A0ABR2ZNH0_9AGAR
MSAPSIILQVPLLVLSAGVHQYAVKPPSKIPVIPRPPQQATFLEKVEWVFMKVAAPWARVERLEVHVVALLEIMFIAGSQYPFYKDYLPDVVTRTPLPAVPWNTMALRLTGILMQIAGGWIRITCHHYLGTAFTWNIHSAKPEDTKLVTSGPYSVVRHPSYTGRLMGQVGLSIYHLLPGSFVRESGMLHTWVGQLAFAFWIWSALAVTAILSVLRPGVEDAELQKRFGKEWEQWSERVRWKVIPGVW